MSANKKGRRWFLGGLGLAAVGAGLWGFRLIGGAPASAAEVLVYKSPTCGCCGGWVAHMRANGFKVNVRDVDDVYPVKAAAGVPDALASCHTAMVDGYVVEGHVPAPSVLRLLDQRPAVKGLAVPGMPAGSPGMEGNGREPYNVLAFDARGKTRFWDAY